MRKVELRMNETYKYEIIKKIYETEGNKKAASIKLKCSVRTVNRLLVKYKKEGKSSFIHGNRGKKPCTTINAQLKQEVIDLYIKSYSDTNFAHFCEIIKDEFNYSVSDNALNRWLREKEILSPKAKRKTKRNMKKVLKAKLDNTKSEKVKNKIKDSIYIIDSKKDTQKDRDQSIWVR